ncbi:MAG: hypothetical protein DRI91_06870 [Aquificota bacterium]|nr:MAG: hypothetical protein DRI91_06870 [Aquificota bacterium]
MATIEKMLESLPEEARERVLEHIREYILDLQDELKWNGLFQETQEALAKAAQRAKKEEKEGKATPLKIEDL